MTKKCASAKPIPKTSKQIKQHQRTQLLKPTPKGSPRDSRIPQKCASAKSISSKESNFLELVL
ncbi:hypothetical protein BBW65_02095 [Helicobacter enhydrae]|uniref:Uncharacterized protein n=1 Tax=Helicobacter enhydrae TaxID=222136 RepID=A0A1B1U4J6_9HELI|nr:hypothetical protein [Helicobacter enhydrae]ANV97669.1 hypothetical protein BBW65_02095 [Helicobacter enhydrae]